MKFFQKKEKIKSAYISVLSQKLYTRELIDILDEIVPNVYNIQENDSISKYNLVIKKVHNKLNELKVLELYNAKVNLNDIKPLTLRQMACFNSSIAFLNENYLPQAYHELYDCIRACIDINTDKDYVNVNEYFAFKFLTEQFLNHLHKIASTKKFCEECQKEVETIIVNEDIEYFINNISIKLKCDICRCKECGQELNDNELFEKNCKAARNVYANKYNIIGTQEIKDIMDKNNIGIKEISEKLRCPELTIEKYLNGKLPTIEHSNILKELK